MPDTAAATDVLTQLSCILSSAEFVSSPRLSEFLRFVVEQKLSGHGNEVKEYVVGVQVYHKSESYDPRTDPTVRVEAGKLRARLARYYETYGQEDPVLISIPKGTYLPEFERRALPPAVLPASLPAASLSERNAARPFRLAAVALAIALGAGAVWLRVSRNPEPATRIVPLTSYLGEPSDPSFSPDGSMVAFSWDGEKQDNFDIYVKVVDAPNAIRLTTDPARDTDPAWSPDGKRIAFLRNAGPAGEVYVMPALGGPEQRLTDASGISVGWSADSSSLLVMARPAPGEPYSGYLVSLQTRERRRLTFPPRESFTGDYDFAASPDGAAIAFCRMVHPPVAEIFRVPASGGKPRPIAHSDQYMAGLAWTPDSREIVFSSRQSGVNTLWRVDADQPSAPVPIPGVETNAVHPSIPRMGVTQRIGYQRLERSYRMWRVSRVGDRLTAPQCILPSQRWDSLPQLSPDGQSIVFASNRAGTFDIWVSRLDGSGLHNLTAGSGLTCGSPRWSPDGTTIAFDGHRPGESVNIYLIPSAGGPLRQMTTEASQDVRPSWSQGGNWIYFSSDRGGRQEIWKMPSAGGAAVQVTRGGGHEAFESPDGRTLYILRRGSPSSTLWRMPSAGGEESLVSDEIREGRWSIGSGSVYFIDRKRRICRLDTAGPAVCLGSIEREGPDALGFTVSRDERQIVYVQPEPVRSDLRMAEGHLF